MSNQTFGAWFGESLKALAIALVILPIVFAILYSIFRVAQRTWWIWGTIFGIILTTFLTWRLRFSSNRFLISTPR